MLFLDEADQPGVIHQDDHDLDKVVGLPPVIRIGAVQFVNVMGFDPRRVFVGPDLTNVADVPPIIGSSSGLQLLVRVALVVTQDQRLKIALHRRRRWLSL